MGRNVGRILGRGNGFWYVLLVFWYVLARFGAFRGKAPKQKLVLLQKTSTLDKCRTTGVGIKEAKKRRAPAAVGAWARGTGPDGTERDFTFN